MTSVKWLSLPFVITLLLPQTSNHKTERAPLVRLQAKIDVVSVPNFTLSELAGQYTSDSDELRKRVVPMGSDNLFVFPDNTYIFTTVSDVPPDTISDKGKWVLDGDILRLESDKDITWKSKRVERRLIIVRRRGHDGELFLVGIDRQLPYFEQKAKDDPEFMFLLCSLKRERTISAAEAASLRKKLIKDKWQPGFYR